MLSPGEPSPAPGGRAQKDENSKSGMLWQAQMGQALSVLNTTSFNLEISLEEEGFDILHIFQSENRPKGS